MREIPEKKWWIIGPSKIVGAIIANVTLLGSYYKIRKLPVLPLWIVSGGPH
ncbi:MAG: hypothetical protein ABSD89_13695 [Halobacteriota archaeon]|jgi:hypothetical protein